MNESATPNAREGHDRRRGLLALLVLAIVAFLALFFCGQVAMLAPLPQPAAPAETGSRLRADYAPWAFVPMGPFLPALIEEALRDLGLDRLPVVPSDDCLLPGQSCATRTPSPTATLGPSGTLGPSPTASLTSTPGPTLTPSRTNAL